MKKGIRAGFWFSLFLMGLVFAATAGAQEKFPTHSIDIIVPSPPGGGTDITARLVANAAEPILGQKVVVINKPGGSSTIGTTEIMRARPDGYTIGVIHNAPLTIVPHVLKTTYTLNDYSYITQIAQGSLLFAVLSQFPAKTTAEFFEYARKNPGKLTYANDGVGNLLHFAGERVFRAMNVKLRPVPSGGAGESIKALLGGHVDVYGGSVPPGLPHIKAGTVRGVFVTTRERCPELPNLAGVADLGHPEAETFIWWGAIGPKNIPAERLAILEKALRQAAQSPKVRDQVKDLGGTLVASPSAQFQTMVRAESAAMAVAAKEIGLVPK